MERWKQISKIPLPLISQISLSICIDLNYNTYCFIKNQFQQNLHETNFSVTLGYILKFLPKGLFYNIHMTLYRILFRKYGENLPFFLHEAIILENKSMQMSEFIVGKCLNS